MASLLSGHATFKICVAKRKTRTRSLIVVVSCACRSLHQRCFPRNPNRFTAVPPNYGVSEFSCTYFSLESIRFTTRTYRRCSELSSFNRIDGRLISSVPRVSSSHPLMKNDFLRYRHQNCQSFVDEAVP